MYNPDRIYLNYSCVDNAHLSDDECAQLVAQMKAKADKLRVQRKQSKPPSPYPNGYNPDKPPINTKCGTWREPLVRKIVAQWNDLYNQAKVKNRSLEACRQYCKKQSAGVDRLEWFNKKNFNDCIGGLKAWQQR